MASPIFKYVQDGKTCVINMAFVTSIRIGNGTNYGEDLAWVSLTGNEKTVELHRSVAEELISKLEVFHGQ